MLVFTSALAGCTRDPGNDPASPVRGNTESDILHEIQRRGGTVGNANDGGQFVVLETGFGRRLVAESDGELLPRIC